MGKEFNGIVDTERTCDEVRRVMADYLAFILSIKEIVMEKEPHSEVDKQNQLYEISTLIVSEDLVKRYFEYKEKFSVCYDNPLLDSHSPNMKA